MKHGSQLHIVLVGKALPAAGHDRVEIAEIDPVVVHVLLGGLEVKNPGILFRLDFPKIALLHRELTR